MAKKREGRAHSRRGSSVETGEETQSRCNYVATHKLPRNIDKS